MALSIASQSWFMLWPSMGPIYLKPRSSKKELEYRIFLSADFSLKRIFYSDLPTIGILLSAFSVPALKR